MDFELSYEHRTFQMQVENFASMEVAHQVADHEAMAWFPTELVKRAGKLGFLGLIIPEEYGGAGADTLMYALMQEELSRVWPAFGLIVSANNSLSAAPIIEYGTKEQKEKFLPLLASGEVLGCYAQTESGAGSDVASIRTKAVFDREKTSYVINGSKTFITNGDVAGICILIARTGEGRHDLSAFIVDTRDEGATNGVLPGFSVGKHEDKMGFCASSTVELVFEDCRIPQESLLGNKNEGFKIAMNTLNGGRINIAAQALGIARGAFDEAIKYAKQRPMFGGMLSDQQDAQFKLADMATEIEAARLMTYRAAWLKDKGVDFRKEAAMAKLFATEISCNVVDKALQLHGGYGYIKEYSIERMYRDIRITRIFEGASEVQKLVIARRLLG